MKKAKGPFIRISSIAEQHQLIGAGKPLHPLFCIMRFEDLPRVALEETMHFSMDFYTVTLKKNCPCKDKYGKTRYDFDESIASFLAPDKMMTRQANDWLPESGWLLCFHPDFLRTYSLLQKIKDYSFFYYDTCEALILSAQEEAQIETILVGIHREHLLPIDEISQDILVAQLELLFSYCNRFYKRQFVTRKIIHNDLFKKVDALISAHLDNKETKGLPTVTALAAQLHLSPKYLSDTLRSVTGQSAQQHIHNKLIEKAKQLLAGTSYSVAEIAYQLGFEYAQSFNKIFKNKTSLSPLQFRQQYN